MKLNLKLHKIKLSKKKVFWISLLFGVILFGISSIFLFQIRFENPYQNLLTEFLEYNPDYHGAYESICGGIGLSFIGFILFLLVYPQIMVGIVSYHFSKFMINKFLVKKDD